MSSFEQSWSLMKDFYFAPEQHYGTTIGYYHPDMPGDHDPENQDKSFYHDRDFLEYHKRESMDEMDQERYDLLRPTPTEPFQRGGSMIPASNRPGGTMGINLANLYVNQAGEGQPADDDLISQILDYLLHEDVHASTYHQIEDDMEESDPNTGDAHEMAAYSLMYPGGKQSSDRAREHYNKARTRYPYPTFEPQLPPPIPREVIR
tara:strand:- start:83 stop:697 length:615 start_codon:yes stop_codon:yes gene_type:complete